MLFSETNHCIPFDFLKAETKIKNILENISTVFVSEIEDAITAKSLCLCRNPVTTAFEVSTRLRDLALSRDESAVFLNQLAEQVEDFSVTLMDQVNSKEEISIEHEKQNMDTYASLLDGITESAIRFSQKKVREHQLVGIIWGDHLNGDFKKGGPVNTSK